MFAYSIGLLIRLTDRRRHATAIADLVVAVLRPSSDCRRVVLASRSLLGLPVGLRGSADPAGSRSVEIRVEELEELFVVLVSEVDLDPGSIDKNAVRGDSRRFLAGHIVHICRNYLLSHVNDYKPAPPVSFPRIGILPVRAELLWGGHRWSTILDQLRDLLNLLTTQDLGGLPWGGGQSHST